MFKLKLLFFIGLLLLGIWAIYQIPEVDPLRGILPPR